MVPWRETGRGVVLPWLCDQFGHMNVRWYAQHFDDASFQVWSLIGCGPDMFARHGIFAVVANTKIDFVRELRAGRLFTMKSGFLRLGNKSVTYATRMYDSDLGTLHATNEATEVFFDPATRKPAAMPGEIRERIAAGLVDPKEP